MITLLSDEIFGDLDLEEVVLIDSLLNSAAFVILSALNGGVVSSLDESSGFEHGGFGVALESLEDFLPLFLDRNFGGFLG